MQVKDKTFKEAKDKQMLINDSNIIIKYKRIINK